MRRRRREAPADWDNNSLWAFRRARPGYWPMIGAAGTTAAPLLAGFSFTLLVLVLPTLSAHREPVRAGAATAVASGDRFSRFPEPAAFALLVAGLLLICCVQAALIVRYYGLTPSALAEWFPEHVRARAPTDPTERALLEWDTAPLPSVEIAGTWYAGSLRVRQREDLHHALRWARGARYSYNAGIVALLVGLALLVFPPSGAHGFWRWALAIVAIAGVVIEVAWISGVSEIARKLLVRRPDAPASTPAAS